MVVTVIVVGNQSVKVDENDYDGVTVSIDIKIMDGVVQLGAKTISIVISRYTDNFYSTALQRLKSAAIDFKQYCVRQKNSDTKFTTLAADLQAVV